MDLNSALYFSKVIQLGSFTKAAELLGLPKSSLSEKISDLERDLKVTLLIRTTRKLSLTDAGKVFLQKIQPALEQMTLAQDEAMNSQGAHQGHIRMSVIADFANSRFIDILAEFRSQFPAISIEVNFDNREVDLVGEGYDLSIRGGRLQDSSLISRHVGYSKFVLVAGRGYKSKWGLPKSPKDIENHPCLKMSPSNGETKSTLQSSTGKKASVMIGKNPGCSANSMTGLKNLAQRNLGIALIPLYICKPEIEEGKLIRILPDWYMGPQSVHLIYPKVAFVSSRMRDLIPFLEKSLRASIE